jgi:DNA repair exonuclease SbcCD nuclease subunit
MKLVLLGDTHIGASRSAPILHKHMKKFYDFFFDYLKCNDITTVLQTGDLFDQRKDIHFTTLHEANKYFFNPLKENNIFLYVISGNHDCTYKNTNEVNSVKLLLGNNANVKIVDLFPETILFGDKTFDFFPWINQTNHTETLDFITNSKSDYAFGHFEFGGFAMYPGTIAETGMDHKLFKKYTEVFSGHYHTISYQDNVTYTGTPYELTWGDCSDLKGFWVFDTDTGEKQHVSNPYNIFEKINYVEDMTYNYSLVKEKYVKILVADKKSQKKFDSFLDTINLNSPHDVKVIENIISESVADAVSLTDLVDTQSMIASVVDNIDTQLDKSKLKLKILALYTEAITAQNTL